MNNEQDDSRWARYYAATANRPPRPTLLTALAKFPAAPAPRHAIDLGCGNGRDTIELLRRGWSVLAIDAAPEGIEQLLARPDLPEGAKLTTLCRRFEDATWETADLINSSFALPFCPPEHFAAVWTRIGASLKPEGRFAGHFFGDRDSWASKPEMTHFDRDGVERLLAEHDVEFLDEEENDGVTPQGEAKHWHIFHVVARRR
jgi:tellurite methyltransferase